MQGAVHKGTLPSEVYFILLVYSITGNTYILFREGLKTRQAAYTRKIFLHLRNLG